MQAMQKKLSTEEGSSLCIYVGFSHISSKPWADISFSIEYTKKISKVLSNSNFPLFMGDTLSWNRRKVLNFTMMT